MKLSLLGDQTKPLDQSYNSKRTRDDRTTSTVTEKVTTRNRSKNEGTIIHEVTSENEDEVNRLTIGPSVKDATQLEQTTVMDINSSFHNDDEYIQFQRTSQAMDDSKIKQEQNSQDQLKVHRPSVSSKANSIRKIGKEEYPRAASDMDQIMQRKTDQNIAVTDQPH